MPVDQVNRIFQERGWAIPTLTGRRGRVSAKATAEQILSGHVKLSTSVALNATLMQTLVNQYGVPVEYLAEYLRPYNPTGKRGTSAGEDEETEDETIEQEEEDEEEEEEENEYVQMF
ncbi:MAG: hypothetical protein NZM44_05140 [Candidatus Calescibacterium sp.]|nr:hypothetical protein [Candidatus Calescibacterium sp.]